MIFLATTFIRLNVTNVEKFLEEINSVKGVHEVVGRGTSYLLKADSDAIEALKKYGGLTELPTLGRYD